VDVEFLVWFLFVAGNKRNKELGVKLGIKVGAFN
jgi:hypothetical protein